MSASRGARRRKVAAPSRLIVPRFSSRVASQNQLIHRLCGVVLLLIAAGVALLPVPDLWLTSRGWRLLRHGRL